MLDTVEAILYIFEAILNNRMSILLFLQDTITAIRVRVTLSYIYSIKIIVILSHMTRYAVRGLLFRVKFDLCKSIFINICNKKTSIKINKLIKISR